MSLAEPFRMCYSDITWNIFYSTARWASQRAFRSKIPRATETEEGVFILLLQEICYMAGIYQPLESEDCIEKRDKN